MKRSNICRTTYITLLLTTLVTGMAFSGTVATDKNPKPEDPFFQAPRATFDCTARDTLELFTGFAEQIPDSTTSSENNLTGYACRGWNEQGPENIYRLDLVEPLEIFAALRRFDDPSALPDEDLDIFLLSDCDTDSCLAGENLEFSIVLDPGTYYLIVDGYGSGSSAAQGWYTLVLEAKELGLPLQICEPGGAIAINAGDETVTLEANLYGQPNLIQNFDCSPIVERGGEVWYAVTVNPTHEFSAENTNLAENLDVALWLFDGCGPTATCLAFADDRLAGQSEFISYVNETEEEVTVYLGVDSYRAPEAESFGAITIEFIGTSNVPTTKQNLGSVRSLFR